MKNKEYLALPPKEDKYSEKLGLPGEFPFTRGIYPNMYQGRLWTMRQYAGFATAEEANKRYKFLLEKGQTGLSVAFDLPTQMGYDSDDLMAKGEVGKSGVAISSINDMETLFHGIPLGNVSTSMTINATASILLALYIVTAERMKVSQDKLAGTVQNDILKEFIARGCYIYPPGPSLKLAVDVFEYCIANMPKWNFISVSGYHIREAGATAAQELGFTLANAICYMEEAKKRELDLTAVAQRISFFFNAHNNFLEEIAKFRAARRLWANILKERFGISDPRALVLRFHTQTAGVTLTAQQPENNVVRVTLQALAAVLGGTQSLHTNAMDEALALPTDKSASVALRTQQIIAYETGVTDAVDPLGGSYYLEKKTDELEESARLYINKIDEYGGAVEAIGKKYYQTEIEKSAREYQHSVEEEKQVIVGVNRFQDKEDAKAKKMQYLKVNPIHEKKQVASLKRHKKSRSQSKVARALKNLESNARGGKNIVPDIIECVRSSVTLGEICNVLREIYDIYNPR